MHKVPLIGQTLQLHKWVKRKYTGHINNATSLLDRHLCQQTAQPQDGSTCLVPDCFFRVHQSWRESREDLVSHVLWCVVAACDSQAIQSSSTWGREGVLQRTKEGRCQHTLLSLHEKRRRIIEEVQLREKCSGSWNTSARWLHLKQWEG